MPTHSEALFQQLCASRGVSCTPISTGPHPTPDFEIKLEGTTVFCEIKQIEPNEEDENWRKSLAAGEDIGRMLKNRLSDRLTKVARQLKAAASSGHPTILVVYDNTPFKMYSENEDVRQAMFGDDRVKVRTAGGDLVVSAPYYGGNRRFTRNHNTSISALAILEDSPESLPTLRVYHNPYASVVLQSELLELLAAPPPGIASAS